MKISFKESKRPDLITVGKYYDASIKPNTGKHDVLILNANNGQVIEINLNNREWSLTHENPH